MEPKKTKMDIRALLLESARRYSVLADEVFQSSVQQNRFVSHVSGQRMFLAKMVVQKQYNFGFQLSEEALEIFFNMSGEPDDVLSVWENCMKLDFVLYAVLENEKGFAPIAQGIQSAIYEGKRFMKEFEKPEGKKAERWQCSACGSVVKTEDRRTMACPVCESGENWMVALPDLIQVRVVK